MGQITSYQMPKFPDMSITVNAAISQMHSTWMVSKLKQYAMLVILSEEISHETIRCTS